MLEYSREMRALEQMEACDIAAIATADAKYYEHVRMRYERTLKHYEQQRSEIYDAVQSESKKPVLDAAAPETGQAVLDIFRAMKGKG